MEWLQAFFAKAEVAAGFIGSLVSMMFFPSLKPLDRGLTFIGGWAAASFGTPLAVHYIALEVGKYEGGIGFAIGLLGMTVAQAFIEAIRKMDWAALISRKGGGS